jgi:hypothetical protein
MLTVLMGFGVGAMTSSNSSSSASEKSRCAGCVQSGDVMHGDVASIESTSEFLHSALETGDSGGRK